MWALALAVVAALPPLTVAPRPDGAVKQPLAQIVMGEGTVSVTPSGAKGFDARVGMQLGATDTVTVGVGAWVALQLLDNGHVVRLDDDLSLRVGELALLKAPKQSQTLEQQLNRLVTRQEQDSAARLIGWNASQTAANVLGSAQPTGGGPKSSKNPSSNEESAKRNEREKDSRPPPKPPLKSVPPDSAPPPPAPMPEPAAVIPLASDAELTKCIDQTVKGLGTEVTKLLGKQLVVRAKLRGGVVVVQLPQGVNTPACAVSWFTGKPGLGAQWADVTVTLP